MKYKIEDGQHDLDPFNKVIHKSGKEVKKIDARFTMADIVKNLNQFKKVIKEKEAQARIHEAEMQNCINHYPAMESVDEETRQAIYVYIDAKINAAKNINIVEQYKKALKELEDECEVIQSQLHFAVPFNPDILNE